VFKDHQYMSCNRLPLAVAVESGPVVARTGLVKLVLGTGSSGELEATGVAGESSSSRGWDGPSLGSSMTTATGDVFGVESALLRSIGDKLRSTRDD
jgi:hypothetical protein